MLDQSQDQNVYPHEMPGSEESQNPTGPPTSASTFVDRCARWN